MDLCWCSWLYMFTVVSLGLHSQSNSATIEFLPVVVLVALIISYIKKISG